MGRLTTILASRSPVFLGLLGLVKLERLVIMPLIIAGLEDHSSSRQEVHPARIN